MDKQVTLWVTTEVRYREREQKGREGLPRKGKWNILLWRDSRGDLGGEEDGKGSERGITEMADSKVISKPTTEDCVHQRDLNGDTR